MKKIFKKMLAKGYPSNWSEEVFVIKKFENSMLWTLKWS